MIAKGDKFPNFKYKDRVAGEFVQIDFNKEIKGQKVVVFGLPGALLLLAQHFNYLVLMTCSQSLETRVSITFIVMQ